MTSMEENILRISMINFKEFSLKGGNHFLDKRSRDMFCNKACVRSVISVVN